MRKLWIVVVGLSLVGVVALGVVLSLDQWSPNEAPAEETDTAVHQDAAADQSPCTAMLPEAAELDPVDPEVGEQVHQRLIADTEVARNLTLFEEAGTPVVWGEVLAADQVHVQPLCLQRHEGDTDLILVRVVVADGEVVCQGTNLAEALSECATKRA
ncbi:hypothetical protein ACFQ3B_05920 [Stackebrandtia endophytica]|uniref:hypothetical protein n=1 Tax=Stackebrandtia endophytica TaxID=1496996 RepID=UPI001154548B|nr:hypothetical protein [Stackebrandtia endophytica]